MIGVNPGGGDVKQIGEGRTADVFEHQEDEHTVIKLFKKDFSEEAIHREFQISQLAYSLGIRTPQPLEILQLGDRIGITYRRVTGVSLLKMLAQRPLAIKNHAGNLASLHVRMHAHRVAGQLVQQKEMLLLNIQAVTVLTEREKNIIIEHLKQLPHDDARLCHGDFHPDNVMVGENDWVIDWMNGTSGNPAGDVARTIILLSTGSLPAETPKLIKLILQFFRIRFKNRYVKAYLRLSGLEYDDIDRWILPVAAARLSEWLTQEEQEQILDIIHERLGNIS